MSLKNTPRIEHIQSLHHQIVRRMFPIVVGAFLIIGLIGMLTIRSTAHANLGNSHEVILSSLTSQIANELGDAVEDLRSLTSESVVRQFGLSAASMNSDLVNRNDVLNLFLQTVNSHPEKYLGIRYVTLDGRVVVQVSRTPQGTAEVDDPQNIASYREDEVFQRTIRSSPGEITLTQIALDIDETGPASIVRPVLRFSSPVRFLDTLDTVLGMVQVDVIVSDILDVINLANQNDLYHEDGRRFVLSNNFDGYMADSNTDDSLNLFSLNSASSSEEAPGRRANRPSSDIDSFLVANPGVLSVAENGNAIISATLISTFNAPDMPWRLILIDDTSLALSESNTVSTLVLLAALAAGFVVALFINTYLRNSLTPFDRAAVLVQQLARTDMPEQLPAVTTQSAQGDDLIQSIGQIANRIQQLNKSMDDQRSRLTRDVEIAARISRETALLHDLDGLLNRVINLICEEYNFYHAQVFVVDDVGLNAVLAYSRGEAGQKLLAQNHKIAVGSESTIGLTTSLGKPVIVNDTAAEAGRHTFNPILPETRAEMALPLFIGVTVIGALDVQSTIPNVFQENELQAFQLLADQIAIAIYNGRLLMESEERVHQIDSLNRQLTRAAWEKTQQTFALERAYHYDLRSIQEGTPAKDETEESLSMPIRIRGEVIGSLDVAVPNSEGFSEGEQAILRAVTDRVALAIENARLFQETDLSLTETSILYEMSRQISEANELDEIIEAIVLSVVSDANGGQIVEFDDYPAGESPDWATITADWSAKERNFQQVSLVGSRLRMTDHALFRDLSSSEVIVVGNLERDPRFDRALRQVLSNLNAGAMVVIPLSMRGSWRGLIMIEFQSPRQFREQELRLYTALIDQAGVAVDNRLLLHQTEKTLDLRERMYAASRSINTAQNIQDLVNAVLLTSDNPHLNFAMSLLEGPLGEYYWPKYERLVARSNNGVVYELDELYELSVAFESPLHARTPEIIRDEDPDRPVGDHNPNLLRMRASGQRYSAIFPLFSANQPVALFYVTRSELYDMPEEDYEVYFALTGQMSTVLQNRRLLQLAEGERQKLSSILDTLPAGVLVLDAQTFLPVQANSQIETLLGRPVNNDQPFNSALYNLYRTGTQMNYVDNELPIFVAAQEGIMAFSDDLVVIHEDGTQIDLLMNAAPILDSRGKVVSIVAAIENISSLRGLENALQDNLRETIALYEATRALSEADEVEQILDVLIGQLAILEAGDAAVVLLDEETEQPAIARTLITPVEDFKIPTALLKSRQQVIVEDVSAQKAEQDEEAWAVLQAAGVAAILTIPMRARNRDLPRGWVVVTYPETHSMSTEEERFLTTLSDGAATSLDNRYLFLSTQSALQEASILYQASRTLTNATSYEDILNAVIDYLIHPFTTQVFIAQLASPAWDTPDSSALVVASWHTDENTIDLQDVELDEEQFLAWRHLSARQIIAVEDIETDERLTERERAGIGSLDLRSFVVLPLRVANRDIGAIWIGSSEAYRATDRDLRIYQSFAEQTSISLEASRLLTQTNRRARQLETSAQVSQFASSILDLDVLLPRLVDLIRNSFNYDHVQVFLMDREGEYALLRASTGEAGRQLLGIGHKLQKGSYSVIGTVTAQNKPILALDTGQADVVHRPNPYLPHTRSEMALPLVVKGKVVGALDVQSNRANAFSEEDVTVLTILAAQISVAIDNARLFEQAEHRANDMSLLFAVTTAAASAESLSGALQNVAEDLRDSLNALSVGIYLPTRYADEINDEMVTMMNIAAVAGSDQPRSEISEVKVGDAKNVIGTSAANFRSTIINKVEEENLYLPLVASARSAVVVPLTSASQLIGLITMEHADPFAYDHETLTLLQTMGGTLSAIIQNAQLLEQVQKQNDQLRELDRIKSEFLANMSHELRTPLNSIIGFSRVILKGIDGPLTEMQEQDLSTIYNSGQHLLGLINDILDQAKIASGKMDLKIDYFDIKPVVEGVRSIGIGLVKDKPININLDIQSGLQQVYGDEFRTRQVLLNLISNASKFTTEGSITLKVYTIDDASRRQKMVRVDVIDTGIGIAQKDMPLLFEAFRQIDSSLTRTAGGTGLGLPISKSLVEMQGGDMIVHSQINVGSIFSITVPTEPVVKPEKQSGLITQEIRATVESPAVAPESNGTEVHETLRVNKSALQGEGRITTVTMPPLMMTKRQVLLIEDNQDRVDQFRRTIQREGFDVFTASIPLEAEAMASGLRPTLIVMDVNFANGAGWNILSKLKDRDDTFDIPIIVVTLSDEKERAEALGVQSFLQHPIMPEQLTTAVLEAERESSMDRILIIDDQPESARLFTQLLDEHGQYRIFAAHNGIEGVSMVARRRPDLVILDLRMPEMDGFEVLQELRSNPETANIPVLVVTGDTLDAVEQDRLADVKIMYKTDISLDDYRHFIQGVETHLSRNGD
jgi:GAF domain-containing protein/DNA-binding response OmpR family regulator